jgi:hypothetical protein
VLRRALKVYGNPASQIYLLKESGNHLESLLSHLSVIVRGFGRQAETNASDLAEVVKRQSRFQALRKNQSYHARVKEVMEIVKEEETRLIDRRFKFINQEPDR